MNLTTERQVEQINSGRLYSLGEAASLISTGQICTIAADAALLKKLPRGNWIGGTIPYFMGQNGGVDTREQVFITTLPTFGKKPSIRFYSEAELGRVCEDGPSNGFTLIIIPAFSNAHSSFARNAPSYKDMYLKPLLGWVSGIHLSELGKASAATINGLTGEVSNEKAVTMHIPLPDEKSANIDIINLFKQGQGDRIRFPSGGFEATDCFINDHKANFAEYLTNHKIDTRLPLVADYSGAMVNVSVKSVDAAKGHVDFYAPVFDDMEYRIAAPVSNYIQTFQAALPAQTPQVICSFNCILNYLYSELEGKRTGIMTGPMTFGEIAYQLLNQTLVYLVIE